MMGYDSTESVLSHKRLAYISAFTKRNRSIPVNVSGFRYPLLKGLLNYYFSKEQE